MLSEVTLHGAKPQKMKWLRKVRVRFSRTSGELRKALSLSLYLFEPGFGAYQSLAQKIRAPFCRIFSFFLQPWGLQGVFQNPRQTPVRTKLRLKCFPTGSSIRWGYLEGRGRFFRMALRREDWGPQAMMRGWCLRFMCAARLLHCSLYWDHAGLIWHGKRPKSRRWGRNGKPNGKQPPAGREKMAKKMD